MTDRGPWYQVVCEECEPFGAQPPEAENCRTMRVPKHYRARSHKNVHDRRYHGGEDVSRVVEVER